MVTGYRRRMAGIELGRFGTNGIRVHLVYSLERGVRVIRESEDAYTEYTVVGPDEYAEGGDLMLEDGGEPFFIGWQRDQDRRRRFLDDEHRRMLSMTVLIA